MQLRVNSNLRSTRIMKNNAMPEFQQEIRSKLFDDIESYLTDYAFYRIIQHPNGMMKYSYFSKNFPATLGLTSYDLLSDSTAIYRSIHPDHTQRVWMLQQSSYQNRTVFEAEFPIIRGLDEHVWLRLVSVPGIQEDGSTVWSGILQDITEKVRQTQRMQNTNRELALLHRINDLILEEENDTDMIRKVFRCLLDHGGYELVWLAGMPESGNTDQNVVVAYADGITEYLDDIVIDMNNQAHQQGPTAQVLLHGGRVITNHFHQTDSTKPWNDAAMKYELRASLVLEFNLDANPGAICIYSSNPEAFDDHEVTILERVRTNLVFGLKSVRKRESLRRSSFELNERVKELRGIYEINNILAGTAMLNRETLAAIVRRIPPAFLYPDHCIVKLTLGELEVSTGQINGNYPVLIEEAMTNSGKCRIEVNYSRSFPAFDDGPFLHEERNLLRMIIRMLNLNIDKQKVFDDLKQSEANLRAIFNTSSIGFGIINDQDEVVMMNELFATHYDNKYNHPINIGDNFTAHMPPERRAASQAAVRRLHTKESQTEDFVLEYTKGHSRTYINIHYYPILVEDHVEKILVVVLDITPFRNMENERNSIIENLTLRNSDLQQFAHIISHNLRAPVANIIGLMKLLEEEEIPETEKNQIIKRISDASVRLDDIIQDLNNILKVKKDIGDVRQRVNIRNVIMEVLNSISYLINEYDAWVELELDDKNSLLSIKPYLLSIFHNLITNSLKYAKPNLQPLIRITTSLNDDTMTIVYKDNGIGIDLEKYGNSVFGLYQRFHLHREGKGIGLYLTKMQVESLGGNIQLKSAPGEGCEFTLTFPVNS